MSTKPARLTIPTNFLCCLVLLAALSCGDDGGKDGPADPGFQEAEEFWNRIHAEDYRSWTRAPGYETRQPSTGPHGGAVEIFVNGTVEATLSSDLDPIEWPMGSLIVKDAYTGDALVLIAGMEKRSGGWYWVEYNAVGDVLASGSPAGCISCHSSGSDFVRSFSLP